MVCIGPCIILITEEKNPTRCHLLLYYAYVRLNMFRAPLYPSSGAHDDSVGYHVARLVLELLLVGKLSAGRMDECPDRRLLNAHHQELTTIALVTTAFGPDTHPSCLHITPNQQQLENQTAYVVTNAIVVSS